MTDESPYHVIAYRFRFDTGAEREFRVLLEKDSLHMVTDHKRAAPPDWTKLETFKCSHCPLDTARYVHCPVAVNLVELLDFFRDHLSHENVEVTITAPERTYSRRTSMQGAASSLLGIYMTTSGCPVMGKLKPMVRFHLPFATMEETKYRAMSMYLVSQYLLQKQGAVADWTLAGLVKVYEDIRVVNLNFANTLQAMRMKDASLNAVSILDSFANFTQASIDYEIQDDLLQIFDAYLADAKR